MAPPLPGPARRARHCGNCGSRGPAASAPAEAPARPRLGLPRRGPGSGRAVAPRLGQGASERPRPRAAAWPRPRRLSTAARAPRCRFGLLEAGLLAPSPRAHVTSGSASYPPRGDLCLERSCGPRRGSMPPLGRTQGTVAAMPPPVPAALSPPH
ncbi:Disintegrin And Metalloproteinase Domain-Containing Protein 23 [Manis pentadactyla]|nr:Disintegrin And Metalloproteinase Domain-Containing Protein 23 [Manis pentadactyla]